MAEIDPHHRNLDGRSCSFLDHTRTREPLAFRVTRSLRDEATLRDRWHFPADREVNAHFTAESIAPPVVTENVIRAG
jgi:hypothetical protein